MAGWLAHWLELLQDPEMKIVRPRQIYKGYDERPYVTMASRKEGQLENNKAVTLPAPMRSRL